MEDPENSQRATENSLKTLLDTSFYRGLSGFLSVFSVALCVLRVESLFHLAQPSPHLP